MKEPNMNIMSKKADELTVRDSLVINLVVLVVIPVVTIGGAVVAEKVMNAFDKRAIRRANKQAQKKN